MLTDETNRARHDVAGFVFRLRNIDVEDQDILDVIGSDVDYNFILPTARTREMMDGQRLSQGAVSKDQDDENSRPLKPHQPCNMHVRRDWLDRRVSSY